MHERIKFVAVPSARHPSPGMDTLELKKSILENLCCHSLLRKMSVKAKMIWEILSKASKNEACKNMIF